MNEFGEYLRELRGDRSLREMERITGLSHTYLSTLEKGVDPRSGKERKPTPETLKKLSETLNVPYEELMERAGYIDEDDALTSIAISRAKELFNKMRYENELNKINEKIQKFEPGSEKYKDLLMEQQLYKELIDITESKIKKVENQTNRRDELISSPKYKAYIDNYDPMINPEAYEALRQVQIDTNLIWFAGIHFELKEILHSNIEIRVNGKTLTDEDKEKLLKIAETMFSE